MTTFDGSPANHSGISNGTNGAHASHGTNGMQPGEATSRTPLEPSAADAARARDMPLGTLLFRSGLVSAGQIQEALVDGSRAGRRLGDILLERGLVSDRDLARALANQSGLPFVDVDAADVDPRAMALLDAETAQRVGAIVVGFQNGIPVVAVADPTNQRELENIREAVGGRATFVVAQAAAIAAAIDAQAAQPVAEEQTAVVPEAPAVFETETRSDVAEPVPPAPVAASAAEVTPVQESPTDPVAAPAEADLPQQPEAASSLPPWMVDTAAAEDASAVAPAAVPTAAPPWMQAPAVEEAPVEPRVREMPAPTPSEPVAHAAVTAEPEPVPAAAEEPVPAMPEPAPVVAETVVQAEPEAPVVEPVAEVVSFPTREVLAGDADARTDPVADEVQVETQPEPAVRHAHAVHVRLANGDTVDAGEFDDREAAYVRAEELVGQLATATGWPRVGGRFIRPETILSVDVVEL